MSCLASRLASRAAKRSAAQSPVARKLCLGSSSSRALALQLLDPGFTASGPWGGHVEGWVKSGLRLNIFLVCSTIDLLQDGSSHIYIYTCIYCMSFWPECHNGAEAGPSERLGASVSRRLASNDAIKEPARQSPVPTCISVSITTHMCMHVGWCDHKDIGMFFYIHIHTVVYREREVNPYIHIYMYLCIYVYMMYTYMSVFAWFFAGLSLYQAPECRGEESPFRPWRINP